jgi:hypothetical protein
MPMYRNLKKSVVVCLVLLSLSFRVAAPSWNAITIYEFSPVEAYRQLEFAVGMVETQGDTLSFNPREDAIGIFQIRPIRLNDYNIRTGSRITRDELYNYETSEKIFIYYAELIGPYNFEQIAKRWNGTGKHTDYYWNRIKEYL